MVNVKSQIEICGVIDCFERGGNVVGRHWALDFLNGAEVGILLEEYLEGSSIGSEDATRTSRVQTTRKKRETVGDSSDGLEQI